MVLKAEYVLAGIFVVFVVVAALTHAGISLKDLQPFVLPIIDGPPGKGTPCAPDAVLYKTCWDGSSIISHQCFDGHWFATNNECPVQETCVSGTFEVLTRCWDNSAKTWRNCQNGIWVYSSQNCVCPVDYFCVGYKNQTVVKQNEDCTLTELEICKITASSYCLPGYPSCQDLFPVTESEGKQGQIDYPVPYPQELGESSTQPVDDSVVHKTVVVVILAGVGLLALTGHLRKWW